jgi:hypothetical protein
MNHPTLPSFRLAAAITLALLSTACVTETSSSVRPQKVAEGPWLEPSPALREQIRDRGDRLPWTHGLERIELIQWFASVGEPSYSTLLELARDPRPDVAIAAFAALGATRDSRLVEHIRAIPVSTTEEGTDQNLERARTLLRLGDWDSVPDLIKGLRDDRPITRTLCSQALYEATKERFNFDPRGEPAAREESIKKWEAWWEERQKDPLLPKDGG